MRNTWKIIWAIAREVWWDNAEDIINEIIIEKYNKEHKSDLSNNEVEDLLSYIYEITSGEGS